METGEGSPRQDKDDFAQRFLRDVFPNIKHPESGYQLGDNVAYKDGMQYEIRSVRPDGKYVLGYTKDGKEVEVEASAGDFRNTTDFTNAYVMTSLQKGRTDKNKTINAQLPPAPKAEGLVRKSDIGGKITDLPKPPSNN